MDQNTSKYSKTQSSVHNRSWCGSWIMAVDQNTSSKFKFMSSWWYKNSMCTQCKMLQNQLTTLNANSKSKESRPILLFSCDLSLAEEGKFRIIPAGKWRRNNMTLQPLVHEWIQVIILTAAQVIIKETSRLWTSSGVVLKKKPLDQWFLNVAEHWEHLRLL